MTEDDAEESFTLTQTAHNDPEDQDPEAVFIWQSPEAFSKQGASMCKHLLLVLVLWRNLSLSGRQERLYCVPGDCLWPNPSRHEITTIGRVSLECNYELIERKPVHAKVCYRLIDKARQGQTL